MDGVLCKTVRGIEKGVCVCMCVSVRVCDYMSIS